MGNRELKRQELVGWEKGGRKEQRKGRTVKSVPLFDWQANLLSSPVIKLTSSDLGTTTSVPEELQSCLVTRICGVLVGLQTPFLLLGQLPSLFTSVTTQSPSLRQSAPAIFVSTQLS
jgi:hypothetical protein